MRAAARAWLAAPRRTAGPDRLIVALNALVFLLFAATAGGFASPANLIAMAVSALPLLMLATGQTFVLVSGGIDLSGPAIVGLTSVAGALVMSADHGSLAGQPAAAPAGLLAMIGTGMAAGAVNGICVAWLRMPPFIVTLTTAMFAGGSAVWLVRAAANTETVYGLPGSFLAFGRSTWLTTALAAGATLLAHVVLSRALLGSWLRAVGYNARTALISGVPVPATIASAYVLNGLFAALAGVILTAGLETASPNHGRQLLLDVIGAAVIGGNSLFGGRGSVPAALAGVVFLSLIGNGLTLHNLSDFVITIVKGAVILTAALLDVWRVRWSVNP